MLEVGGLDEVEEVLKGGCECGILSECAALRWYSQNVNEIPHSSDEPVEIFTAQALHDEIRFARDEVLVVGGECCQ